MGQTIYNFGAGPAMLPKDVMERAQAELLDWNSTGISVMEMSHRSPEFINIAEQAEADLCEILAIPDSYEVLFLFGGASCQFAMVPMNLLGNRKGADYLYTGLWSAKALAEARRFCEVNIAVTGEADNFMSIPETETWKLDSDAAYVYYTANETIGGLEFHTIPEVGQVPLVTDMTSSFLSQPLDVSRFGLIFAGAQKNVGPAGLTVVIIREDLVGSAGDDIPTLYDYTTHVKSKCMYNTPPTYNWYMAGLVFQWIKKQGGLAGMVERNKIKSEKLYAAIDTSDYYHNPVTKSCRSRMNIPFTLVNEDRESDFLKEAKAAGLITLGGHRSVGGMRASLYNAMPEAGVDALIDFMADFEQRYG
jgi:phosphoserine aminotransferase